MKINENKWNKWQYIYFIHAVHEGSFILNVFHIFQTMILIKYIINTLN